MPGHPTHASPVDQAKATTVVQVKYWEAHVTLEPVFDERLATLQIIAGRYGFRIAELLMQKSRKGTAVRSDKDSFATGRSRDPETLETSMEAFIAALLAQGFQVWRKKIEACVMDEKL